MRLFLAGFLVATSIFFAPFWLIFGEALVALVWLSHWAWDAEVAYQAGRDRGGHVGRVASLDRWPS